MLLENLTKKMYDTYEGLPSYAPIVRNGQMGDAFEVAVFKTLYGFYTNLSFVPSEAEEISKYIVAAPDAGIDIFVQNDDGDDACYDVIQVKNKKLTKSEIKAAFAIMKETINTFCSDVAKISSESCKKILSESSLDNSTKNNCHYFVVHTGDEEYGCSSDNETVITKQNLVDILENGIYKVKEEIFEIKGKDGFLNYKVNDGESSVVCNISCYDLAVANNKFYKSEMGRNILFWGNLREDLGKKSKSFLPIKNTILTEPERFYLYNNGITIVADDYDIIEDDGARMIRLNKFSIVNGAQTTSALGRLLTKFNSNRAFEKVALLKKAYVLARIVKVNDKDISNKIAINSNTQSSILNRDMVANRPEQVYLQKYLLDGECPIYMETRRGAKVPSTFNKRYKHRITSNEKIAQISYSAFEFQPYTAKDKKSKIFNNDYTHEDYNVNKDYHLIFNHDKVHPEQNGVLFRKTKDDIEEALFINHINNLSSNAKKAEFHNNISKYKQKYRACVDNNNKKRIQNNIDNDSAIMGTIGCSKFYCITNYFMLKERFNIYVDETKKFDYERFYNDREFRDKMIHDFGDLVLMETVRIINRTAKSNLKSNNVANWARKRDCEGAFIEELEEQLTTNAYLKNHYIDFFNKYKK